MDIKGDENMKALGYLKDIKNYLDPELWIVLDEAIEELEALQSCSGCKYEDFKKEAICCSIFIQPCMSCNRFAIDKYEAKG